MSRSQFTSHVGECDATPASCVKHRSATPEEGARLDRQMPQTRSRNILNAFYGGTPLLLCEPTRLWLSRAAVRVASNRATLTRSDTRAAHRDGAMPRRALQRLQLIERHWPST